MYSTTGKKKGKQKWTSAGAKHKSESLDQEWQKKQQEWAAMSKPKIKPVGQAVKYKMPTIPEGREAKGVSLDTGVKGAVTVKQTQHYTGTKIIGIAQMAKSNAIPIYNPDHIEEIARMRR
jgi:hypothetical protein